LIEPGVSGAAPDAPGHPQNWTGAGEEVMPELDVALLTALETARRIGHIDVTP